MSVGVRCWALFTISVPLTVFADAQALRQEGGIAGTECRIPSQELLSTAQSMTSQLLQGVCNPRELDDKLSGLETMVSAQMNVLKTMILNMEDKLGSQEMAFKRQYRRILSLLTGRTEAPFQNLSQRGNSGFHDETALPRVYGSDTLQEVSDSFQSSIIDQPKNLDSYNKVSDRRYEIETHNNTITTLRGQRVFRFYWNISNIEYKITHWGSRRSLRSDNFYIFQYGYNMYMRIYPRQDRKNFYIHVGLTPGQYDHLLDWPFKLKHYVSVLDFSEEPDDISSRVWDPQELCSGWNWRRPQQSQDNFECVGLGFPVELLRSRNYVRGDSIVIRLTVYLDTQL